MAASKETGLEENSIFGSMWGWYVSRISRLETSTMKVVQSSRFSVGYFIKSLSEFILSYACGISMGVGVWSWTALDLQPDAQMVAGRVEQGLGHSQISFGRLNRSMAKAQPDLFEGSMAGMRQLGERAAQIVRRQPVRADYLLATAEAVGHNRLGRICNAVATPCLVAAFVANHAAPTATVDHYDFGIAGFNADEARAKLKKRNFEVRGR